MAAAGPPAVRQPPPLITRLFLEDPLTQVAAVLTFVLYAFSKAKADSKKKNDSSGADAHAQSLQLNLWRFKPAPKGGETGYHRMLFGKASAAVQLTLAGLMLCLWGAVFAIHGVGLPANLALTQLLPTLLCVFAGVCVWQTQPEWLARLRGQATPSTRIPVTIVTGFLGSGKTTMIKHILTSAEHKRKILVVENEVGAIGVDHELLVQETKEEVVLLQNGCVCCSVRADLTRVLKDQLARAGRPFDAIVVETTGMAKPAPIIQSFFADFEVRRQARLDAVLTLVDASNLWRHVFMPNLEKSADGRDTSERGAEEEDQGEEEGEGGKEEQSEGGAQKADADGSKAGKKKPNGREEVLQQIAFADRVVLNKADLVDEGQLLRATLAVRMVNPRCEVLKSEYGQLPLEELLNLNAFSLDRMETVVAEAVAEARMDEKSVEKLKCMSTGNGKDDKGVEGSSPVNLLREDNRVRDTKGSFMLFGPDGKLTPSARQITPGHSEFVNTVTITIEGEVVLSDFNAWVAKFLNANGERVYRFKGLIAAQDEPNRLVLQAVHMVFEGEKGKPWAPGEKRVCSLVLIGLGLDSREIREDFKTNCVVGEGLGKGPGGANAQAYRKAVAEQRRQHAAGTGTKNGAVKTKTKAKAKEKPENSEPSKDKKLLNQAEVPGVYRRKEGAGRSAPPHASKTTHSKDMRPAKYEIVD